MTSMGTATAARRCRRNRFARSAAVIVLAATLVQLLVGALAGASQFAGKGFGERLAAYPVLMLALPLAYRVHPAGRRAPDSRWTAFLLVMTPFLVDVTGNTLDLYDRVSWWDDANHAVNWFLLCSGLGLLLRPAVPVRWLLAWLVTGVGALLAIAWEVGEWYAFIRHGTELTTAYQDTLGDEVLGSSGAALAGLVVAFRSPRHDPARQDDVIRSGARRATAL